MKRFLSTFVAAMCLMLAQADHARAITWGEIDQANRYPFVGLVITPISATEAELCSGTLISPTLFVTAAHCFDSGIGLPAVAFGLSPLTAPTAVSFGVPAIHPEYFSTGSGPDVAVIQLLFPVPMAAYGQIPGAGVLSDAAAQPGALADRFFRTVGYGIDGVSGYVGAGKPGFQVVGIRRFGEQSLINVQGATSFDGLYARFSANNGTLAGGGCLGDSGGPVFVDDTNVVAAVTSFGTNANCAGTTNSSRLDVGTVLEFIAGFLP